MGYDFGLMRLDPRPDRFPFSPDPSFIGSLIRFEDPTAIERYLLETTSFKVNGVPIEGMQPLSWDTPDGGSLDIVVSNDWIDVDVHAHWRFVRQVYDHLRSVEPELLIADKQTSTFYDSEAFQAFLEESYRRNA